MEEAEEQRRLVQLSKKKVQRLTQEMQDMKLHLEEQMARNNELERKQRRFDSELNMAHEDVRDEHNLREKLQKERDQLVAEKYKLESDLEVQAFTFTWRGYVWVGRFVWVGCFVWVGLFGFFLNIYKTKSSKRETR